MVTGKRINTVAALVKIRSHEVTSGIATDAGGNDEGPNPHELIEAALTACTIETCQLYANRKQWPLDATEVTVAITSEAKGKTVIQCQIKFRGNLTTEQTTRLLDIANKCPIHNLLSGTIEIQTQLVGF